MVNANADFYDITSDDQRSGIWRFDPDETGQAQSDGARFATGIRNAVALTYRPETRGIYPSTVAVRPRGEVTRSPDLPVTRRPALRPLRGTRARSRRRIASTRSILRSWATSSINAAPQDKFP